MIESDSPEHKNFIENEQKNEYTILTGKLLPGESIACSDDPDMRIKKTEDGEVCLIKKCFLKNPFS